MELGFLAMLTKMVLGCAYIMKSFDLPVRVSA
jgi:hypothetical protein